jgi:hypothetical protein
MQEDAAGLIAELVFARKRHATLAADFAATASVTGDGIMGVSFKAGDTDPALKTARHAHAHRSPALTKKHPRVQ